MKARRAIKPKSRIAEFASKLLVIALSTLVCLWMMSGARAEMISLKEIKKLPPLRSGTDRFVLKFNREISKVKIDTSFERDFIQFSLKNVNAYPAISKKVKSVHVNKVFAYQYSPSVARARILLNGSASDFSLNSNWQVERNKIILTVSKKEEPVVYNDSSRSSLGASIRDTALDANEKRLLAKIKNGVEAEDSKSKTTEKKEKKISAETDDLSHLFDNKNKTNSMSKAGGSEKNFIASGFLKMMFNLSIVLGLVILFAFGYKKFFKGSLNTTAKNTGIINVLSRHSLGAKQSIALIKVGNENLVVGITGEQINLIANLGEQNLDNLNEIPRANPTSLGVKNPFDQLLRENLDLQNKSFKSATNLNSSTTRKKPDSVKKSVRSSIKQKLRNFKQL